MYIDVPICFVHSAGCSWDQAFMMLTTDSS